MPYLNVECVTTVVISKIGSHCDCFFICDDTNGSVAPPHAIHLGSHEA